VRAGRGARGHRRAAEGAGLEPRIRPRPRRWDCRGESRISRPWINLETTTDESSHQDFKGLPSPAAAGAVVSTLLLYLILRRPQLELDSIGPTPVGQLFQLLPGLRVEHMPWWILPLIACLLPLYGALMVSRVRYVHAVSFLTRRGSFFLLVNLVFAAFLLFAAPIPVLFLVFQGFALLGLVLALFRKSKPEPDDPAGPEDDIFAHGGRD
jgi:phosphatidylserine synthase